MVVRKAVLNWALQQETIEQVVLGMGREAAPFMQQLQAPSEDGDVLVIEVDGKCPPIATEAELAKRRGKRQAGFGEKSTGVAVNAIAARPNGKRVAARNGGKKGTRARMATAIPGSVFRMANYFRQA